MTLRYSCIRTLQVPYDSVNCIAFSPDGLYLAIGYDYGPVAIVKVDSGSSTLEINWNAHVTALAWRPSSTYELITGYSDGRVIAHTITPQNLVRRDVLDLLSHYTER